MIFLTLKAGGDNFMYLIGDEDTRDALAVDPVDAAGALNAAKGSDLKIKYVFNTHMHGDHTGGNSQVVKETSAHLLAHELDANAIGSVDTIAKDGDVINVGRIEIKVIHTPGHTPGGACLLVDDKLITGDSVFLAGCGRCSFAGGSVDLMFESFDEKIKPLQGNIHVYPGHDYSIGDLKFALSIESGNEHIQKKLNEINSLGSDEIPRSTLADERLFSPFMRYDNPELIESLKSAGKLKGEATSREVFKLVRGLKDSF